MKRQKSKIFDRVRNLGFRTNKAQTLPMWLIWMIIIIIVLVIAIIFIARSGGTIMGIKLFS